MIEWICFQFVMIDRYPQQAKPMGLPISPHLRR
jgi:hypothetical protein